jgi:hypothetical protein
MAVEGLLNGNERIDSDSVIDPSKSAARPKTCWICGAIADTSEHKIKKSSLVLLHGSGPYRSASSVLHAREGGMLPLKGPNAKQMK